MAKGIAGSFKGNLKSLISTDTLKDGALVAAGGVGTPIVSGILQGIANKIEPGMVPVTGPVSKIVDLGAAAVLGTIASFVAKNTKVARMILLGGMAGIMSDITTESVLPAVGLSDYLTLPPGMSDYLTLPGMNDYATKEQLGLGDWLSTEQVGKAGPSYSQGENF